MKREQVRLVVALLIALLCDYFLSATHEGWVVLAAFLVCDRSPHAVSGEGLYHLFILMLAILFGSIAVMLSTSFLPVSSLFVLPYRLLDAAMGGIIGMLCAFFIFPARISDSFAKELSPVLMKMSSYLRFIALPMEGGERWQERKQQHLSAIFFSEEKHYPEWVYAVGFNPGLREGWRFFLIRLERVMEMMASIDLLLTDHFILNLSDEMRSAIQITSEKNAELIELIIQRLYQSKAKFDVSDMREDMVRLDALLPKGSLALFMLYEFDDVRVMSLAIIRDLKEMREGLLKLVMAIPADF